MNKRQAKKRRSNTHLLIGHYIYIKPSEWNKVANKGRQAQISFLCNKLKEQK